MNNRRIINKKEKLINGLHDDKEEMIKMDELNNIREDMKKLKAGDVFILDEAKDLNNGGIK